MRWLGLILLLLGLAAPVRGAEWITPPTSDAPAVYHFRRDVTLDRVPEHVWADVSADNRFILYVNDQRAGSGPATSIPDHWRYARIDLAPYLKPGENHIAAVVWNFVIPGTDDLRKQTGPLAQTTVGTGFWLRSDLAGLDSDARWRVRRDPGHGALSGIDQLNVGSNWFGYYVAGAPETIDGTKTDWDWQTGPLDDWEKAVPVDGAKWTLSPDPLPVMIYAATSPGVAVRGQLPVMVPAHSTMRVLLQRDQMISAYPQFAVSGGKGAVIRVTYAETLYDANGKKGVRDEIGDRQARGVTDRFTADGQARVFEPLHWRVWRFMQIEVETGDQPLKLQGVKAFETRYPFEANGKFESDDPELNEIWQIGWRTATLDAHETYMDSAYWEQLQYAGDTRLQMLISYAVSGDARLAVNAIDAFGWSNSEGGLTEGAYPSRSTNVIAPFSLLWIGMMHDYWMNQPDTAVLMRNLPRMREVLAWYQPYLHEDGLLGKNPTWNFVDWVGKARDAFPSFDEDGKSCLTSLHYLGALQQAFELESDIGNPVEAAQDFNIAMRLRAGIQAKCWDEGRRLYADDPSKTLFSQHANALAVLYDVAPEAMQADILTRITGKGIEPADGLIPVSYYFSWYLVRAYEHAGLSDGYIGLLQTWRDLLPLHFSTWPEAKLEDRSDSHAWSGHPTADLLAIVAGVQSAAPGYMKVRIAPHLGNLQKLDAVAMTPSGPVSVWYMRTGNSLTAEIDTPLAGEFVWQGKVYPLTVGKTKLRL